MSYAIRGSILHFPNGPFEHGRGGHEFLSDGVLEIHQGRIKSLTTYSEFVKREDLNSIDLRDFAGDLIIPGFVDIHNHYPQVKVIASYGSQLLEWLNTYTFPEEVKFSEKAYAEHLADFFIHELLRNGTTTSMSYSTVHKVACETLFKKAQAIGMCLATGKVLMDQHAPQALLESPRKAYEESMELIDRWHGLDRLTYAVTLRFAPTSTHELLDAAKKILHSNESLLFQTHLSENKDEISWVSSLFPHSKSYLDIYRRAGLVQSKSVFAHAIHLEKSEWEGIAAAESSIAFCPTSNAFLGSGLFPYDMAKSHQINIGLGSDVGAGTSYSMIKTMHEAYKISQLNGYSITPLELFYLATMGGARAIGQDHQIGNFEVGKIADFLICDLTPTPIMKMRIDHSKHYEEALFAFIILGDDRNIRKTFIYGKEVYSREDS